MKRIFFSVLLIFLISGSAIAGDYYTVGINCFNRGMYLNAEQNLQRAVRISPKNVDARYYLAQSYLAQNMIPEAEEQYERIILLAPNSNAARLSQKGIYLIQQAYRDSTTAKTTVASDGNNYLAYVISAGEPVKRWAKFPINVYIEPKHQKALAIEACKQWQQKTGKVKFNFVSSRDAQITIKFLDKLESTSTRDSYIAGFSKPYYQGDNIVKSEIQILAIDPDTKKPLDDDFVYFSVLHELGHSLGFKGHSPESGDVMFGHATSAKTQLTQRDVNTMKMLYGYDKKTLLAKIKGSGDIRLKEAMDYVKASPNKSVGWENLGDVYRERKLYPQAVSSYKKAIAIEPDKAEAYNLLGITYSAMGDSNNAYNNLKRACDLDKKNVYYVYQFAQVCSILGQKSVGRVYINNFIKTNPSSANDGKLMQIKSSL